MHMDKFIPLSIPNFEGNEKKYVDDALTQGWVSTGGMYISKLEKELAAFLHTEDVAACQSGTSALHLSLIEAGIMPGDVVLLMPTGERNGTQEASVQVIITPATVQTAGMLIEESGELRFLSDSLCRQPLL